MVFPWFSYGFPIKPPFFMVKIIEISLFLGPPWSTVTKAPLLGAIRGGQARQPGAQRGRRAVEGRQKEPKGEVKVDTKTYGALGLPYYTQICIYIYTYMYIYT